MRKFWSWIRDDGGGRVLRLDGPIDEESFWSDGVTPKAFREDLYAEDGDVTIFSVNRDMTDDIALDCDLRAFGDLKPAEHIVLHHDDVKAVNTEEKPFEVSPASGDAGQMDGGMYCVKLPALSWNVIRLSR